MQNRKNFSFDVGMASLGVAVNESGEILHSDVLLMHLDAGSVKAQAERRRQFRTRNAHKAREAALASLWQSIGKEPLQRKSFRKIKNARGKQEFIKTQADNRLEREFPSKGDETVYTSCLLRIMLLEGEPMADWQIYKALHSSIQRRGYDRNVPWKTKEKQQKKPGKDENPEAQVNAFKDKLRDMTPDKRYHLPCYYDAWKMGLWDNTTKKRLYIRQQSKCKSEKGDNVARGYNASRELVTDEVVCLFKQAAKQIPELKAHVTEDKLDQLLYGTQHSALDKHYPSYSKIDGLLGQKYPRFENRIVSQCALIPRLNVCKSEKRLAIEVGFLLRLVHWRYEKEDNQGNRSVASLTGEELINQFSKCEVVWKKKAREYAPEEYAKCFRLTPSKVVKMADSLGGNFKIEHKEIPARKKHTGRSRFSQPALYLVKSLILSEKTPQDFYTELSQAVATREKENPGAEFGYQIFPDVPYQYFADDFKFLEKMGDSREAIYVPDMSLAERYVKDGDVGSEPAIQRVISSCNWPELRHRLNVFHRELANLAQEHGKPDAVHLEFIREDFLSDKKKNEYTQQSNKGREARKTAVQKLKELNIAVLNKNILRYRLYAEQNHQCLYTGDAINIAELENYDIDHIFPQKDGGPDAYYNKVLTSADVNRKQKGKRLPCECAFINWPAFKTRLGDLQLGENKKKLLAASTREEAQDLIEKYTGLSGTAYIARLARDIVCLRFGWQPGAEGEQQRVFVFSGGLTSKVAKKYKLYQALGDGSKHYQKDRSDHRHHALDAMVISYLRQWARDKSKTDFFEFPAGIDVKYFAKKLANVHPHYVTRTRPALAEQPQQKKNRSTDTNKVNAKEYKNISKDPDERGQWYANKSETRKGTSQHGYLFYKDDKGKVCHKTIHSFRSPYAVRKEVEKKASEILGLFYQGKSICLPSQTQITATQLGRDAHLKFGEYEIIKINKGITIIAEKQPQEKSTDDDSTARYRIRGSYLKKIQACNELLGGKSFTLQSFSASKDKKLIGEYKVANGNFGPKRIQIINTQTKKEEDVYFSQLVKTLTTDTNWPGEIALKDMITINRNHVDYIRKVIADDMPKQNLPEGDYLIKGFLGGGNNINLTSQNGTVYRLDSKVLEYSAQRPG